MTGRRQPPGPLMAQQHDPHDVDDGSSNEFYYWENGRKCDAALHAEFLGGADDAAMIREVRERILAEGAPRHVVESLWPERSAASEQAAASSEPS